MVGRALDELESAIPSIEHRVRGTREALPTYKVSFERAGSEILGENWQQAADLLYDLLPLVARLVGIYLVVTSDEALEEE
jgi:hypothetical protein